MPREIERFDRELSIPAKGIRSALAVPLWDNDLVVGDLVGFTALAQRLSPRQIAQLLNSFFEEMLQEVFAVGGTLDKFIGDCIMAFFGAPEPQPDHADRALRAARRMLSRLDRLNACRAFSEPLQLRIAINSGKAVVGDVGSSQRVDYTVIGTTINLASRMQHICLPGECVVSEATFARLARKQCLVEMKDYHFKGIDQPVRIYQTKRFLKKQLSSKSSNLKSSHLLTVIPSCSYRSPQDNRDLLTHQIEDYGGGF